MHFIWPKKGFNRCILGNLFSWWKTWHACCWGHPFRCMKTMWAGEQIRAAVCNLSPRWQNFTHCTYKDCERETIVGTNTVLKVPVTFSVTKACVVHTCAFVCCRLGVIPTFLVALTITLVLVFFPRATDTPPPFQETEVSCAPRSPFVHNLVSSSYVQCNAWGTPLY